MHRVLIGIPAYNAAKTIGQLVETLKRHYPQAGVLVVDDGSMDNTLEAARAAGAQVIRHDKNSGKGVALKTAFSHAIEGGFDAIITMDADLQHAPAEVASFLREFNGSNEILIGVRSRGPTMPIERKISNSLSSFVASIFGGQRIADAQCGFRLIPVGVLRRIKPSSNHYDLEPELLIRASRAGFKIRGVVISTIYNNSHSEIRPGKDTLRFLKLLVKSLFW